MRLSERKYFSSWQKWGYGRGNSPVDGSNGAIGEVGYGRGNSSVGVSNENMREVTVK